MRQRATVTEDTAVLTPSFLSIKETATSVVAFSEAGPNGLCLESTQSEMRQAKEQSGGGGL